MSVIIGEVETFPATHADKAQVLKILEESAEVFAAWQAWDKRRYASYLRADMIDECADVIQAVSNMLDALGVHDMRNAMERCEERNRERGRFDADVQ